MFDTIRQSDVFDPNADAVFLNGDTKHAINTLPDNYFKLIISSPI